MTVIDPNEVDWTKESDDEVLWSAHSDITPAIEEAKRRGLTESAE